MAHYKNAQTYTSPDDDSLEVEKFAQFLLSETDWTQLPDSGLTDVCVAAFATYRASIRTIRQTNPDNPTWPDAPTEEWS